MKKLITLLTVALTVLSAMAQAHFRELTVNSNLSSNMVNTIFQDHDGSIYFGTASGLDRYDGYGIHAFLHHNGDSTSLHDNYVRRLQRAADGRLWILAGNTYGIFDPTTDSFDNNIEDDLTAMGLGSTPQSIYIDDADFWIYVRNDGVYRFCGADSTLQQVRGLSNVLTHSDITDLATAHGSGSMFMISNDGILYQVNTESMNVDKVHPLPLHRRDSKVDYSLYIDSDNVVWIYGSKGLFAFNPVDSSWLEAINGTRWPSDIPKAVFQDSRGRIWIGYDHIGLAVLDKNGHIELYQSDEDDNRSLPANTVTAIMEDKAGSIWVGTRKKGISICNKSIYKFELEPWGDVNCIMRDSSGNLWLGTDNNGVRKIDAATGAKQSFLPDGISQQAVVCLAQGADGTIWAGTYDNGLMGISGNRIRVFNKNNGLASNDIWSVIYNPDGTLLLGTLGEGLQILNPATMESHMLTTSNSGLPSDFISSMCQAPDGRTYLGTAGGVAVYNRTTGSIDTVAVSELSNPNVNQVFVDSRGLLWIATRDGFNLFDPRRNLCMEVPISNAENKSFILGIAEDLSHSMWISAGGMLFNIKVRQEPEYAFDIRRYDVTDGLQNCDFNQRSFCRLPDGEILVGGLYGVNRFYPERIEYNTFAPSVRFTGLSLLGEPVEIGKSYDGRVILPRAIGTMDEIKLNHNRKEFSVMFATDDYTLPEHTRFSYTLDGFNNGWTTLPDGVNRVSYTNLPPGKYTLRLRAINNDGVSSPQESKLAITILPPFYATVWAKIFYVLLAIGCVVGAYLLIRRRERERYRRRTQEESLRKQEELNQLKFKFFTNISHDLRTPLTLITAPLESLLKKEHDETTRRQLTIMQTNANRLLTLVNQLLDFRKNEMSGLTLHASENDFVTFVRQICDSFLMFSEKKNINFKLNTSRERLPMAFDQDKMGKTIMNLLSNAFKFTPDGGSVTVDLTDDGDTMLLRVQDTGIGVSDADKEHIFDRFYQASNTPDAIAGSGIGLSLVAEYVKLHGGTVGVEDAPGGGAVFSVRIPIRRLHNDAAGELHKKEPEIYDNSDSRPKILLVDDNDDLLEFMSQELSADFRVYTASNGREALDKMPAMEPDMIVCDIMMPVMDGIEMCRCIKSDAATAAIPFMLLTAKHDVGAKIEGLTLGADDYMTKPFDMDILRLRINKLLALKKKGMRRSLIDPEPAPLQITSLDEQLIEKAVNYVEANMERPELTVEELSAALGMSRVHLYKRIKELTGKAPIEFIRVMRLKRAAQLLRESQLNVSEIAYRCGFNHPKYFSRYFKEEFGVLPSVYQDREGI